MVLEAAVSNIIIFERVFSSNQLLGGHRRVGRGRLRLFCLMFAHDILILVLVRLSLDDNAWLQRLLLRALLFIQILHVSLLVGYTSWHHFHLHNSILLLKVNTALLNASLIFFFLNFHIRFRQLFVVSGILQVLLPIVQKCRRGVRLYRLMGIIDLVRLLHILHLRALASLSSDILTHLVSI